MAKRRCGERSWWFGLVGLSIGAALLVGCGGDDADVTTDETVATTDTTTTDSTPTDTTTTDASPTTSTTTATSVTTEPQGRAVDVFFGVGDGADCSLVSAFARTVDGDLEPIGATFAELVGGPTTEETDRGAASSFSSATAASVLSVTLDDGLLKVDFADLRPLIPNASTSCGSEALLAQLNGTAFQFQTVDRVRYSMLGSCDDFANWLQRECFEVDRSGRQLDVPTNERASGSGCTPPDADELPEGRWFGFVESAGADDLSFDLACWFTGTAAAAAASEDGEESPPPNDYHIRNELDRVRTLDVAPATEVSWLPDPGDPASTEVVAYGAWTTERADRPFTPGVWLVVEDGLVVAIEEQYVP